MTNKILIAKYNINYMCQFDEFTKVKLNVNYEVSVALAKLLTSSGEQIKLEIELVSESRNGCAAYNLP